MASSTASDDEIAIRVVTLDHHEYSMRVATSMPVSAFRVLIEGHTGIPPTRQRLIHHGKVLSDGDLLSTYRIQDGHTLHLVARPIGHPAAESSGPSTSTATPSLPPGSRDERQDGRGPNDQLTHLRQGLTTMRTMLSVYGEPGRTLGRARDAGFGLNREPMDRESKDDDSAPSASLDTARSEVATEAMLSSPSAISPSSVEYQVGQWLDVKDTVNQWLEATVMQVTHDMVFIQYNHWPDRWNEWILKSSTRLAPFRTRTVHEPFSPHLTPTPLHWIAGAPSLSPADDNVHKILPEMRRSLHAVVTLFDAVCELSASREHESALGTVPDPGIALGQAAEELAPLLDRFGRLIGDLAPHIAALRQTPQALASSLAGSEAALPEASVLPVTVAAVPVPPVEVMDDATVLRSSYTRLIDTTSDSQGVRRPTIDVHVHMAVLDGSGLTALQERIQRLMSATGGLGEVPSTETTSETRPEAAVARPLDETLSAEASLVSDTESIVGSATEDLSPLMTRAPPTVPESWESLAVERESVAMVDSSAAAISVEEGGAAARSAVEIPSDVSPMEVAPPGRGRPRLSGSNIFSFMRQFGSR